MSLPSKKQLFLWGGNYLGELGLGHEAVGKMTTDPTELIVPDGSTWAQIACGNYYTAAVSSNGDLFTWGYGWYGQLGHGNKTDRHAPTKVEIPGGEAVVKVAYGLWHTAAVTATGKLLTWYVTSFFFFPLVSNIGLIFDYVITLFKGRYILW